MSGSSTECQPPAPDGYVKGSYGAKYYRIYNQTHLNHAESNAACQADDGALLAMAKNLDDAKDMKAILREFDSHLL